MKLPTRHSGISTMGITGVSLMILHITGYLTGWGWTILYVILILSAIGNEFK
jgi:hypothetical protein